MRDRPAVWAALLGVTAIALPWTGSGLGDYGSPDPHANNPAPGIAALADGDLEEFTRLQPVMGLTSLVLRAPLVALAGDDKLLAYRLGSAACLLVLAAAAFWVQSAMARRGAGVAPRALVSALMLAGPATFDSLKFGHPEEALGAGLCVAAVLAAARGRPLAAGVLLGLALGTKPTFAIAAVPVLMAARAPGRLRLVAVSALVAAVTVLPGPLADPDRFETANERLRNEVQVRAWSVWYPLAEDRPLTVRYGPSETGTIVRHTLPGDLSRGEVLTLGGAATVVLLLLLWRAGRRFEPEDALALLALGMLLRCMLDPFDIGYYHLPALVALAAWEGLRRPRLPIATLLASAAFVVSFTPDEMATSLTFQAGSLGLKCAVYLLWTGALAAYLVTAWRTPGGRDRPASEAPPRWTAGSAQTS